VPLVSIWVRNAFSNCLLDFLRAIAAFSVGFHGLAAGPGRCMQRIFIINFDRETSK
jgi:hypothetical protein